MSQLPLELYRPICEFSHFEDLPNISVVSRAFQEEAERLLWWKLSIRGSVQETFARPERFLHFPRLHHYVQRLDLWIHREPHEESFPAVAVILLEKLTNLIALTIIGRDYCGEIFDNCTFQLHFLFTTFALDQNFAAFLQKQPSITEWRRTWQQSPPGDECDRLSPDILPNLTVFCNSNGESNFDVEIHNGRNLTHMSISRPSGPVSLAEFTRAASHIEALSLYCTPELLEVFPELLPNLECLSVIDYDAVEVRRCSSLYDRTILIYFRKPGRHIRIEHLTSLSKAQSTRNHSRFR
jgi:hypothetical protein